MEKTAFKGRVYMTHPTKAIYKWLLADYVKVSNVADDEQLYTEADLARSFERITTIDYHQEIDFNGIKFVALNAGHVLGAAMFFIEIAGVKILYTGDYSREEDRHLMAAETPSKRPDVLVCESTYGVHSHQPRMEREKRFTSLVHEIVARGGRCLIPVFALGRAQELLLILDEYWQSHPELHAIPVHYASPLANKCMSVYQTYVNMMNDRIRRQIAVSNPFIFRHVSNLRSMDHFRDVGPCVMMASPAMLQSGLSRELLELWCSSPKNGLIIPGYVVEGTLAKTILTEPKEIPSSKGPMLPLKMTVEYISFSAHVDFAQNSEFIDILKPPHLILVHGEANEMARLKGALQHKYGLSDKNITAASFLIGGSSSAGAVGSTTKKDSIVHIHTPRNCEAVELNYRGEKVIKIVGSLAASLREGQQQPPLPGTVEKALDGGDRFIEGVLVGKDFEYQLMAPSDLAEYVQEVQAIDVTERQAVVCRAPFTLIEYLLTQLYGAKNVHRLKGGGATGADKESAPEEGHGTLAVLGDFIICYTGKGDTVIVEWPGNPMNDVIADAIVMLLLNAASSRTAVKATNSASPHHHHEHGEDAHGGGECKGAPGSACAGQAAMGGPLSVIPPAELHLGMIRSYLENHFGTVSDGLDEDGEESLVLDVDSHCVFVSKSDYVCACASPRTAASIGARHDDHPTNRTPPPAV